MSRFNTKDVLDEVLVRTTEQTNRSLSHLVIKPTVFCYHKCPYCNLRQAYYKDLITSRKSRLQWVSANGSHASDWGHMPLDMALRAIDEAAALGMKSLQLSGGDPLMYPYLEDVIQAGARHPGVFVFMNSVGTRVTLDKARKIIGAGLGAWNFSVDTLNPIKYARLRGVRDALPVIMKAIETVREAATDSPGFCINYMTVITRHNFRDIPDLLRHCVETGVASIYLMNLYGDTTGASLLTESDIEEFRHEIVPEMLAILREKRTPETVQTNASNVLGSFFSSDNSDSNYAHGIYWPDINSAKRACRVPVFSALVEPDGRVLPCCFVEISHETEVGNVADGGLTHVWGSYAYVRFRQERLLFCQRCSSPRNKTLGLIPKMCRQFNE